MNIANVLFSKFKGCTNGPAIVLPLIDLEILKPAISKHMFAKRYKNRLCG